MIELASLRELITEKPVRGWGEDVRTVEAVIRDDPEVLAMFREAMLGHAGRPTKESGNNVTELDTGVTGNSRAYSIDRVQRECEPEVVAKVMSGEMSPNAALVKAGIRENRQVYVPKEPAKAVEKLRELFRTCSSLISFALGKPGAFLLGVATPLRKILSIISRLFQSLSNS